MMNAIYWIVGILVVAWFVLGGIFLIHGAADTARGKGQYYTPPRQVPSNDQWDHIDDEE